MFRVTRHPKCQRSKFEINKLALKTPARSARNFVSIWVSALKRPPAGVQGAEPQEILKF